MTLADISLSDWAPALSPLAGWPEPDRRRRLGRLTGAWARLRAWQARRETLHALQALDCRTLKDIGIGAPEIESVVYSDRDDRVRRYDRNWWRKSRADASG